MGKIPCGEQKANACVERAKVFLIHFNMHEKSKFQVKLRNVELLLHKNQRQIQKNFSFHINSVFSA